MLQTMAGTETIDDGLGRISYGRSLGSGPAIDFASRNPVAAMVLECPFLSISRVVTRGLERYKTLPQSWDIFPSYKRMSSVKCPVFIAHGNRDAVVPYSHAQVRKKRKRSWPSISCRLRKTQREWPFSPG